MTPIHTHDCTECILLGTARGHDIYVHPASDGNDTLLIRTGSDGPDYVTLNLTRARYSDHGKEWLYALGLYDGFERGREHEIAQQVVGILDDMIDVLETEELT